jgi:hypothetical protein
VTARVGIFAFDPIVGVDVMLGFWDAIVIQLSGQLGAMFRVGDRYAAVAGASWLPGGMFARARLDGVVGGWRAYLGAQFDDVILTVGWRGFSRENSYTLHEYELSIAVALE